MKKLLVLVVIFFLSTEVFAGKDAVKVSLDFTTTELTNNHKVELEAAVINLANDATLEVALVSSTKDLQAVKESAQETITFLMNQGISIDQISVKIASKENVQ